MIVGMTLVGSALLMGVLSVRSNRQSENKTFRKVIAEQYASELLEFFRSLSSTEFKAYMQASAPYPLCPKVNLINSSVQPNCANTFTQPDANALISDPILGNSLDCAPIQCPGNATQTCFFNNGVNRYYQVQVLDISNNMQPVQAACGSVNYNLGTNERYSVTAVMTWAEKGGDGLRDQIQLSTVLMRHP